MCAKLLQSHPTLCDPMDSHLPGSSIHGIIILENQLLLTSPVQFSHSVLSDSLQPHGLQHARLPCASPTSLSTLFKLMSIKLVMPSNHLILRRPFLLLLSIFPSIRVFSNESVLRIRWPKYWSISFSVSPSKEYSGLISLGWTG